MLDFSFLAVPNIEGMRLSWYIQIFGLVLLFGVSLFFVIYFLLKYRRKRIFFQQLDDFDRQAQDLGKQLLQQKITTASGKKKLVLFIEYLEKFITTDATGTWSVQVYANLWELLSPQWFSPKEIEVFEHVLYTDKHLAQGLEEKIDEYFTTKSNT